MVLYFKEIQYILVIKFDDIMMDFFDNGELLVQD